MSKNIAIANAIANANTIAIKGGFNVAQLVYSVSRKGELRTVARSSDCTFATDAPSKALTVSMADPMLIVTCHMGNRPWHTCDCTPSAAARLEKAGITPEEAYSEYEAAWREATGKIWDTICSLEKQFKTTLWAARKEVIPALKADRPQRVVFGTGDKAYSYVCLPTLAIFEWAAGETWDRPDLPIPDWAWEIRETWTS